VHRLQVLPQEVTFRGGFGRRLSFFLDAGQNIGYDSMQPRLLKNLLIPVHIFFTIPF
jgi:hypothetical protein